MVRAALDPFGWFVVAIIVFNLLAPLFRRRPQGSQPVSQSQPGDSTTATLTIQRPTTIRAQQEAARQAAAKAAQAAQQAAARAQQDAARAAERDKLRKALEAMTAQYTQRASDVPPLVAKLPSDWSATSVPTVAQLSTLPAAQRVSPPVAPVVPSAPAMPQLDDATLMTLPATMSLGQLSGGYGPPAARPLGATAAGALAIVRGPQGLASAFIAAAIVGPCAAFRPLGHTPGGW